MSYNVPCRRNDLRYANQGYIHLARNRVQVNVVLL